MAAEKKQDTLLFTKDNYLWMAIGGVVMLVGLFLMMGGKSTDPNVFNKEEIYSTRRITVAPLLIVTGLLIEIYAIMKKPKQ
jgi:cbb3-type cytochrome oxidase subunit 1